MGGAGFGIIICDADAPGRQWDSPGPVRENKEKKGFLPEGDVAMWFGSLPVGSFTTFK